jgi:hypothetical protein
MDAEERMRTGVNEVSRRIGGMGFSVGKAEKKEASIM